MKKPNGQLRKPNNQIIVSKDEDKFLIGHKFAKSIAIISPFERLNGVLESNFNTPVNRSKRIQILYEMIPDLSKYTVSSQGIDFDCISTICKTTDIFKDNRIDSGIIHFDVTSSKEEHEDYDSPVSVIEINPRIIFNKLNDQEDIELTLENLKYKFKTTKFKVFTVILEQGFIVCTVNQDTTKLYLTINNPKNDYVGNCVRKEIGNISSNIAPLWPIFKIDTDMNKLKVHVDPSITDQYKHINKPILLKIQRQLDHPETVLSCIGFSH